MLVRRWEYFLTLKGNSTNFAKVSEFRYEAAGGFMIDSRYSLGTANVIDEDLHIDSGMAYTISSIEAWTRAFQIRI